MDEYTSPPKDKDELMVWIKREWDRLMGTIQNLDEAQMVIPDEGGWAIKDHLAHLAEWERFLRLNHLQRIPAYEVIGVDPETFAKLDEDGENAILFERSRNRSPKEIVDSLIASHAEVLDELEKWTFADLMKPRFDNGDPSRTIGLYVAGNTYFHYREHRQTIEKILAQNTSR